MVTEDVEVPVGVPIKVPYTATPHLTTQRRSYDYVVKRIGP